MLDLYAHADNHRAVAGLLPHRADEGLKYTPLMRPNDQPAIWLNATSWRGYRPEMRKYYYDPSKYKTYLEQLGIKYPTVKPDNTVP